MAPRVLGIAIIMLDNCTIAPAMPIIAAEFSANGASFAWIESAELPAQTFVVPVCGRSIDYFSRKLILQNTIPVPFIGTTIGGFANSIGMLLADRAI